MYSGHEKEEILPQRVTDTCGKWEKITDMKELIASRAFLGSKFRL
jgi:hypothetical protein